MTSEDYKIYEQMTAKFYDKCRKLVSLCFKDFKDKVPLEEVLHFVINGDNIIGLFDNILEYQVVFPKKLMLIDNEKELLEEITNLRKKIQH